MTTEERLEKLEKELIRVRRFNRWLVAMARLRELLSEEQNGGSTEAEKR